MDGYITIETNVECIIAGNNYQAENITEVTLDDLVYDILDQLSPEQVHDFILGLAGAQGDIEFSVKLIRVLLKNLDNDLPNIHQVIEVLDNVDKANENKTDDLLAEDKKPASDPYKGIGPSTSGVINPQF